MPNDDRRNNTKKTAPKINEQDAALWKYVKKSVTPLQDNNSFEPHGDLESDFSQMVGKGQKKPLAAQLTKHSSVTSKRPVASQMPSYSPPVSVPKRKVVLREAPQLADFERRDVRKIVTGNLPIDATLDLHGMTQRRAKPVLKRFLHKHQSLGDKVVLVITGKGNSRRARRTEQEEDLFYENPGEGGVLQYMVPNWLDEEAFRSMVISYQTAHRSHGEEGALYIRIRKFR